MITLQLVTMDNYEQCLNLKRERTTFVGDSYAVLANAYIYQKCDFSMKGISPWDDDFRIMEMIIEERISENERTVKEGTL